MDVDINLKVQKKEKSSNQEKEFQEKKQKDVQKKNLTLTVEVTLILKLKNVPFQKTWPYSDSFVNDEVPSASSQVIEHIRIIQEIVLPEASKIIDLVMNK